MDDGVGAFALVVVAVEDFVDVGLRQYFGDVVDDPFELFGRIT